MERPKPPKVSRRQALRLGRDSLASLALLGGALALGGLPKEEPKVNPDALTDSVLTPEELTKYNILIHNTPETQLYLKGSVLELPPFRDAATGKNGGVVICLVENESLSWNVLAKLPEEPREVILSKMYDPEQYTEKKWEEEEKYAEAQQKTYNGFVENDQQKLADVESGKMRKEFQESIDFYTRIIDETQLGTYYLVRDVETAQRNYAQNPNQQTQESVVRTQTKLEKELAEFRNSLAYYQTQMADLESGKTKADAEEGIRLFQDDADFYNRMTEALKDPQQRVEFLKENGERHVAGRFFRPMEAYPDFKKALQDPEKKRFVLRYQKIVREHPQWLNKVYIYIVVGGKYQPDPIDSFPSRNQLEIADNDHKKNYGYHLASKRTGELNTGIIVWHEVGHYVTNFDDDLKEEAAADDFAIKSILNAAKRRNKGDNRGYPFIFVNKKGTTITKNLAAMSAEHSA